LFNITKVAKSFFLLAFLFFGVNCSYADDIATTMCKNYVPAVWAIAKPMRDIGIPMATAEEHVYKMGIEDKNIRLYLRSLVEDVYKNPDATSRYIESGHAVEDCVKQSRGF
jgi:hypothetical protein